MIHINCLFVCLLNFLHHFLPYLLLSLCFLFYFFYFLTRLLPDVSIYSNQNKPVAFPGRRSQKATKPGFSFVLILFCNILLWIHGCFCCVCFSFLANVNSRSRSLYAISRPSVVCRLSVCLSVTLVHPTQAVELFGNFFFTIR